LELIINTTNNMNVYYLSKLKGISGYSTKVGKCKTNFCSKVGAYTTQFSGKDNAITRYDYSYDSQGSFCKPLEDFTDLIDRSKIECVTFDKVHRLLKVEMKWDEETMTYPMLITDGKNHHYKSRLDYGYADSYEYLRIGDGCLPDCMPQYDPANFSDNFKLKMAEQIGMNTTFFLGLPSDNCNNAVDKTTYDELGNTISLSFLFEIVVRLSALDLDFAFNVRAPNYNNKTNHFESGSSIFKVFDRDSIKSFDKDLFASYIKEDCASYASYESVDAQDLISSHLFNHIELIIKHKSNTMESVTDEINTMASGVLGTLKHLTELNNVKL
tara:strand:- start:227 stop:1207 length:981 start_codon:yes stop_codon:yes gene_type:complete